MAFEKNVRYIHTYEDVVPGLFQYVGPDVHQHDVERSFPQLIKAVDFIRLELYGKILSQTCWMMESILEMCFWSGFHIQGNQMSSQRTRRLWGKLYNLEKLSDKE